MPASAARVARNEALFAEANDKIAAVAGALPPVEHVPFLCECPDGRCSEIVELSLGEYGALRLFANRFVISPRCRGGDHALTAIVERADRFTIVDRLE
jgi:hypothetical protein